MSLPQYGVCHPVAVSRKTLALLRKHELVDENDIGHMPYGNVQIVVSEPLPRLGTPLARGAKCSTPGTESV